MFKSLLYLIFVVFLLLPLGAYADSMGQVVNFNIAPEYDTSERSLMRATLRHISSKAYWYVADEHWNSISEAGRQDVLQHIKSLANEFDNHIYPLETSFFGSEPNPGIDGDSKVVMALIPMRNSAGGYIDTANSVPKNFLPRSNEREMVYLNINLINDVSRIQAYLGHEFQHLITLYERDIVRNSPDDVWLNELRSEYAVDLLGYNQQSLSTNIQRRALTFLQNTKDSLTEWKNELIDYSSIALFANYVGEKFGQDIIGQTTRVKDSGINAIRSVLQQKGLNISFETLFISWWVANILNDRSSQFYGYSNSSLRNFAVKPEKIISLNSYYNQDTTSIDLKDWQGGWYQINRPDDYNNLIGIKFNSQSMASFSLGVIVFSQSGAYKVYQYNFDGKNNNIIFDWKTAEATRLMIMPFKKDRLSGFTENESPVNINFTVSNINSKDAIFPTVFQEIQINNSLTSKPDIVEGLNLKEGDFIKSKSSPDVFIINEYGFKRLVLNPAICLMYGHLGERGCFSATKDVEQNIRDKYATSNYLTNGETNDKIIYELIQIDDDSAYLKKILTYVDPKKVFKINTKEFKSYELR